MHGKSYHEEEVLGKAYDAHLMRRLMTYILPYKAYLLLSAALLLFASGLQILQPYLLKVAIDRHIVKGALAGLGPLALLYLAILLAEHTFRALQFYLMRRFGQKIMADLRMVLFTHVQRLPFRYFDRNPVGRIMTRLTSDVENLNELFTSGLVAVFGDLLMLFSIAGAMVLLHLRLSLVAFAILPPLLFATVLFREKARASYRLVRMKLSHLNAFLQESLSGIRIIQATTSEAHRFHRFDGINQEHKEASLQAILSYALFYPAVELLATTAIALIIWYGGGEVLRGTLTLGTLVAFLEYIQRFFAPVKDLSEKYNILQAAMASSERIFELLDSPIERGWTTNGRKVGRLRGGIEFRNVWFAYEKNDYVLKDVSFTIAPGEQVALVGATGAGKSTVVSLLSRLYEPQRGRILLDGIDIRELELRSLRERIGFVLQEPFLFSGSIQENITLGRRASEERVQQAAKMAKAPAFLEKLKDHSRERVFERGSSLSMGERQLIALARALALDPDILILDEATASIDPETEDQLQQALTTLMAGRTVLWIAHRLSTIRSVQRILVFHKGELREEGTHQVLLQRGGIFAKLYKLQFDGHHGAPHRGTL